MIPTKTAFTILLAALFLSACQSPAEEAGEEQPTVRLQCQPEAASRNAIYAIAGQNKVKLATINNCDSIPPASYEDYEVPDEALAAAGGRWSGVGDYFYAIEEDSSIAFYQGWTEEAPDEESFHYFRIGAYENGQFNLKMPLTKEALVGTYALSREAGSHILFVGMKSDTLVAEYFQMDGILPPVNQLNLLMTSLERAAASPLAIGQGALNFTSELGDGKFVRTEGGVAVLLLDKKVEGRPLKMEKILSEDYSIPTQ